ncbi:MAG TPA: hypothetical protein VN493_18155 [Thermoanaerobaculia bacterium]|nr:hypothetical protein [Thermoanaerobaculia bacterium]
MKPTHVLALIGLAGATALSALNAGPEPAVFAPGVISTGEYESHAAFSRDGGTIYFLKNTADFGHWNTGPSSPPSCRRSGSNAPGAETYPICR